MIDHLLTPADLRARLTRSIALAEADAETWRPTTPALAHLRALDAEFLRVQLRAVDQKEGRT
jgi:hypothetical protein